MKSTDEKVNDIYDAILGHGTHKGSGMLDRLIELENWRGRQGKVIGVVVGIAVTFGYILSHYTKIG